MTPEEWNDLVAFGKPSAIRKEVERQVRLHLSSLAPGLTVSTNDLVEALYPRKVADESLIGDVTRTGLYGVIGKLAPDKLKDCCMKGEVSGQYMGKPKRPWLWFAPAEREVCCMCGQVIPKNGEE